MFHQKTSKKSYKVYNHIEILRSSMLFISCVWRIENYFFNISIEIFLFKIKTFQFKINTFQFKIKTFQFKIKTFQFKIKTFQFKIKTFLFKIETLKHLFPQRRMQPLYLNVYNISF